MIAPVPGQGPELRALAVYDNFATGLLTRLRVLALGVNGRHPFGNKTSDNLYLLRSAVSPLSPRDCGYSPSAFPVAPILYYYVATPRGFLPYNLRDSHGDRFPTSQVVRCRLEDLRLLQTG